MNRVVVVVAAVVVVALVGSCASWQREVTALDPQAIAGHTEKVAVGVGQRVVAFKGDTPSPDDGGLTVEATPFCRVRAREEVELVRVEKHTPASWISPVVVVIVVAVPVGLLGVLGGVFVLVPETDPAPGPGIGEWLLGSAALASVPMGVALLLMPDGAAVEVPTVAGRSDLVTWTAPAEPCDDEPWVPATSTTVELRGTWSAPSGPASTFTRSTSTQAGVVPPAALAAFSGWADWCGVVDVVATTGLVQPDIDPSAASSGDGVSPFKAVWSAGQATVQLAPRQPRADLQALQLLDDELAIAARQCCERASWDEASAGCVTSCESLGDPAQRLGCEGKCRVRAVAAACP
ncbi:MAG: hypothetical protein Q8O67_21575 [Deltaproteobacteria bacterium]|nr:hypothetical protein [Deltaproteobacteria bacterium]